MPGAHDGWTAVVPVKRLHAAKSRLQVPGVDVADLAVAFLTDVLAALQQAGRVTQVVVATSDTRASQTARSAGALVVDDTGHGGINAAATWAAQCRAGGQSWFAIVSDLPGLTSRAVDAVLAAAAAHPKSFLADAAGTGTTMWLTRASASASAGPCFGLDSRAAHRRHLAADLVAEQPGATGPWLAARLDVDTAADLERVQRLGVGTATSQVLKSASSPDVVTVLRVELDHVVVVDESGEVDRVGVTCDAGWLRLHAGQRLLMRDGSITPPA